MRLQGLAGRKKKPVGQDGGRIGDAPAMGADRPELTDPQWRWHLDEVFVKVNGKLCYLWRAVDDEGEVLEAVVTAKRDKRIGVSFTRVT